MIGKVEVKSYAAKASKIVRRGCPRCKKKTPSELVDYGKGGRLLFCGACGHTREVKQ